MSTFLYFVPKQLSNPIQSVQELRDAGIKHIEPDQTFSSNYTVSGPGGESGALVSMAMPDRSDGARPVYDAETQKWRKHPCGTYYVGIVTASPPTPEALQRPEKKRIEGESVTLLDGNEWVIPVCVPPEILGMSGCTLPRQYDLDDKGELLTSVRKDFRPISQRCYEYFERFVGWKKYPEAGTDEAIAVFKAHIDLAAELIGINYRVDRFEVVAMLGLLGSDEYHRILRASIEADGIDAALEEEQKKLSASADSDISGGEIVAGASE